MNAKVVGWVELNLSPISPPHFSSPAPPQVMLTLETSAPAEGPPTAEETVAPPQPRAKAPPPVSQLVRLLWGEDTAELQMALGHVPHVAMYLSLQLDSETLQEEVGGPPVESVHTHTAFPQPRSPEQGSVCTVCTCGRQWLRR